MPIYADNSTTVDVRARLDGAPVQEQPGSKVDDEGRREIWHWFVLAAAALLTIEWFLYAWRMRV